MKTAVVLIALLVVIVGAIALWGTRAVIVNRPAGQRTASGMKKSAFESGRKSVTLFFLARDGYSFHKENREIERGATTTEDARRTLAELVTGPRSGDFVPTVARETKLLNLLLDSS